MAAASGNRRIGWMGWSIVILALFGAALFGAWRYALSTNAVALLDWGDGIFAGSRGVRLALTDAPFGPLPAQKLDVFVPDAPPNASGAPPHPVLVFFYGGGWHSGLPGEYHFVGRTFARLGYVVVIPGYRLTPEGKFPRMLEDSAAGMKWVHDNIARFGGDPDRVFVMGHSAGAYNAAMLSLERQWLGREGVPEGFIKGMIGLSGPYDFYPFTSESARKAFGEAPDPALTQPINFVRGDAPPMLLLSGDADTTVKPRNSLALAKALTEAGRPTQAVLLGGVSHEGTVMKLAAPFSRDRRVIDAVLAFLAAHGGPSAPVQGKSG